jgi:uncharacterized membrane protein
VLWVLLDVLLGVVALVVLALVVLRLWQQIKALGREVARAGTAIGEATDRLADLQAKAPAPRSLGAPAPRGLSTPTTEVPDA